MPGNPERLPGRIALNDSPDRTITPALEAECASGAAADQDDLRVVAEPDSPPEDDLRPVVPSSRPRMTSEWLRL
ncbi:hypothetical protein Acy02nite_81890 [Actinoplanes cyaneus]|uniref:Uncharacterized protein n=1 Tax=Actinoplanes cyaneus TaxID=52696 RepID=A0A919IRW5_9ACTN|nr:hypothetical protein Acy02nite_81890 [Actinoplanes cyaneus]